MKLKNLFVAGASLLSLSLAAQQKQVDVLIKSGNIIDVKTGQVLKGRTVAIEKDKIIAVVADKDAKQFRAAKTLNARGKYIMPGLWDMHMHFGGGDSIIHENKNFLPLYLAHGVTSIRDAAADISPAVLAWRDSINKGTLQGPTIYTSGPKLEGYKSIWRGDIEIGTSEELQQALDSLQKLKVDFIKITDNTLSPALYMESIREARKRGYKVSAHIPNSIPMKDIVDAGLSSVEHLGYMVKAGINNEAEISHQIANGTLKGKDISAAIRANYDTSAAMAMYRYMAEHGTAVTPTLNGSYAIAYLDQNNHANDPYLLYLGKGLLNTYTWRVEMANKADAAAIKARHENFERTAAVLPLLQKAGVMILAGTDAGYLNSYNYPGIGIHSELALFVKYGLTPLQALQASVINGPAFMNKSQYGSIETGKLADVLILDANPLENISATEKIHAVVTKGSLLTRSDLDKMLTEIKRKTAMGL